MRFVQFLFHNLTPLSITVIVDLSLFEIIRILSVEKKKKEAEKTKNSPQGTNFSDFSIKDAAKESQRLPKPDPALFCRSRQAAPKAESL